MALYKGNDKDNTYFGTSGDDQAYGLGGTDVFYGNAGNDTLNGDNGNDFLEGGIGNDILNGGAGNDSLSDSVGDDTYLIAKTDGFDTLNDLTGTDTVKFSNVASTDITQIARLGEEGNSLLLSYGSDNQLTVQNYFSLDAANRIEQFQFSDGVTWIWTDIKTKALKSGTNGNDILYGYDDENDTLNGLAGNDILKGYGGNDTLNGGAGNDQLFGLQGNDTYLIAKTDGSDTIYEYLGNDVVKFSDVASTDITQVIRNRLGGTYILEDSLRLVYGVGNQLKVENFFSSLWDARIEQFQFSDGVIWDLADIKTKILHPATDGNDVLYGYDDQNDTLNGLAGNDKLYGDGGDDKLDGGIGNDIMVGGEGADEYWVDSLGDRIQEQGFLYDIDTVYSSVSFNLQGGAAFVENLTLLPGGVNGAGNSLDNILIGNDAANSLVGMFGNDTLKGGNGNDSLRGDDDWGGDILDGGNGIDTAHYWNNTEAVTVDLNLTTSQDTKGAGYDTLISIENLNGSAFDDTLIGNAVSNALYGGKGNDTLQGNGGNDSLLGDVGNDVLDGGDGVDYAQYWNATARVVVNLGLTVAQDTQGAGLDTLTNIENVNGSGFNDILTGNTSSNWLLGGAGNDTLNGGLGNDFLKGGAGQDAFVFNTAWGISNKDILTDFSVADDTIQLENSLFTALTATGILANTAFKIIGNGNTVDGDDHLLYNTATGGVFYDADGNGAAASVWVAVVGKSLAMTAADFVVI